MPESLKSQMEQYLKATYASKEYLDPALREIVDVSAERLLELAEDVDKSDSRVAFLEMELTLQEIDAVLTGVHQKVVATLGRGKEKDELTPEQAELLQKLEVSYDDMADTLDNYGYKDKIPEKKTVMDAIKKLGTEMLEKIGKFGQPTVLITPAGTLKNKIQKLDGNKKYDGQKDTCFGEPPEDELWGPAPAKLKVSIVDGTAKMPQLPEDVVKEDWEACHKWLTAECKKEGMEMITAQEYAMLAQKSLWSYELAGEEIIDNETITVFNCEQLTKLGKAPCARWLSDYRWFCFDASHSVDWPYFLRSRPSVQVLEYDEAAEKVEHVLTPEQKEELLETLKARFEANMKRHLGFEWMPLYDKLNFENVAPEKLWALNEMERTGGEPDVVGFDELTGEYIFIDCSAESPAGRRNCVYDREAQEKLKSEKPDETCNGNAVDMAAAMGIELLTEEQYRELQKLGKFDNHTWTWLNTPADIRKTGAALNALRFYDGVLVNQFDAFNHRDFRGFRGSLRI